uniref:Uncharacterized protein n=1 Tax=Setaria italica TaxID=4555 RepID=K3ZYU9_SETIT
MHWTMYYPNWERKTTDMREHEMQSLALKSIISVKKWKHPLDSAMANIVLAYSKSSYRSCSVLFN